MFFPEIVYAFSDVHAHVSLVVQVYTKVQNCLQQYVAEKLGRKNLCHYYLRTIDYN